MAGDRTDQRETLFSWSYDDGTGRNLLPADEGAFSLEGIAHAAMIASHFVFEGRVRYRAPFSDKFDIFVTPPRAGSWQTDFVIALLKPETWSDAVAGVAFAGAITVPKYAFKLLRRISNRATGTPVKADETAVFEEAHPGNFDALVEAATPSLTRAHRAIRDSKTSVKMSSGPFSFEFNRETRLYIETNRADDDNSSATGNTAAYSVNQRTGRVYLDEPHRTVPFLLHRDAPARASVAIARSLEAYASIRAANSDLVITYRGTRAQDGRLKKILIFDAFFGYGLTR